MPRTLTRKGRARSFLSALAWLVLILTFVPRSGLSVDKSGIEVSVSFETQASNPKPAVEDKKADLPSSTDENKLPPLLVSAPTFHSFTTPSQKMKVNLFFGFGKMGFGWPTFPGRIVLTTTRAPQRWPVRVSTVKLFDAPDLSPEPESLMVESLLNSVTDLTISSRGDLVSGGFQGAIGPLRGVGAKGRSPLVLWDGIPINDPFGGEVTWAELPQRGVERLEIVPGGGATAWGNNTIGGVMQFFTQPAQGRLVEEHRKLSPEDSEYETLPTQKIVATGELLASVGDFGTTTAAFTNSLPTTQGVLQVEGQASSSRGYSLVADWQRGPIDLAAPRRDRSLQARWRQRLGNNMEFVATIRGYEGWAGGGKANQATQMDRELASLMIAGHPSKTFSWNSLVYAENRDMIDAFSVVNVTRTAETPVFKLYSSPASAVGLTWTGLWSPRAASQTTAGFDWRSVHGEAREHSSPVTGQFTRASVGGGQQSVVGAFLMHDHFLAASWHLTASVRVDSVKDSNGHMRETDTVAHQLVRNDLFPSETKTEFNPSLGLVWNPRYQFKLRGNAQASYRQPSLEERFQAVGHDTVIVLPNPHLRVERNTSFELGADYIPRKTLTLSATVFLNELRDLVSELPTERAAGQDPLTHTALLDYSVRERVNLEEARVQGVDLSLKWQLSPTLSGDGGVQFNETKIIRASVDPALFGKRLANVSKTTATISGRWQISKKAALRSSVRYLGKQFDDMTNALPLRDAVIADFRFTYALTAGAELFYSVTNLFETRVETSRSITGTFFVGSPRINETGVRLHW